ncbi:MAG TPA: cytochrome b N-terminal domain-containing protein [Rhodanobacteraceae bacterium]|nr:cytochrome b N-terminal domain-containing protein [Rhodanobacteraceae bacterium]
MSTLVKWFNDRLPSAGVLFRQQASEYYAPKNFNFMYFFGSLALLVLVNQIVTGTFLAMFYNPSSAGAFDSVQYIMRDVEWGWLVRYMHEVGASMFFIVIYLHMFRGLMYGSYQKPRELVWLLGMLLFLVLMAEAFMGYVLPWGNMSFWGAKVIITLFSAVPGIGEQLVQWIMGTLSVPGDPTLNRFFALHVVALPLVLIFLVVLHLGALHDVGSNNPDGVDIHKHNDEHGHPLDGIPFHPYYTVDDIFHVGVFLVICAVIIFFAPKMGGFFLESANWTPANDLVTPPDIKPVWYFAPFYAIVRSIPSKGWGVIGLAVSVLILFFVPWLDRGKVRSIRYRGLSYKIALVIFAVTFLLMGSIGADLMPGWIGAMGAGLAEQVSLTLLIGRILIVIYFAWFIFLWAYTFFGWEHTKPVPERVKYHG